VKTLAVDSPCGLVLVALRAEDELDYCKLARVLGVDRDPLTAAAPNKIAEALGVAAGFETILTDTDVACFVDERVLGLGRVVVSGGVNDRLYELAPRLLRDVESPDTYISFGPWASIDAVGSWRSLAGYHERVARLREVVVSLEPRTFELVAER
jgi:prolyl-tRNA editing enzyme YbaK/EbsC (Cys-tRNA(Pro) deacylase)